MGKVEEKIGMEKLIELLNKRIKEGWKPYGDDYSITKIDEIWKSDGLYFVSFVGEDYPGPVNLEHLLTKQAGLIKWLVENDKIDTDAYKTVYSGDLDKRKTLTMSSGGDEFYQVIEHGAYESLLMLLSISDTPIDDLISYLR